MTEAQSSGPRPLTIVIAAVLLALEGLIGLGYAGIAVGQIRMSRAVVGVGVAILMASFRSLASLWWHEGYSWAGGGAEDRRLLRS